MEEARWGRRVQWDVAALSAGGSKIRQLRRNQSPTGSMPQKLRESKRGESKGEKEGGGQTRERGGTLHERDLSRRCRNGILKTGLGQTNQGESGREKGQVCMKKGTG